MFFLYSLAFSISFSLTLRSMWKRDNEMGTYFVATCFMFLSLMYQMNWSIIGNQIGLPTIMP